jgi:hypothetical protein
MRTMIALAAILTIAAPAQAATRNFAITGFTKIRVEGPYRVTVQTNVPPFAKASGSPGAVDRVAVEMRGDTLVVRGSQSWGGNSGGNVGPVDIAIGTHDLTNAAIFGSGTLAIDRVTGLSFALSVLGSAVAEIGRAAADQLNVSVDGSGGIRLAGSAKKLTALARGISTIDARSLTTPHAALSADGTTTVDANVTQTATINGWGTATVRLTGNPSCIVKANGSASVSGCKSTQ